MFAHTALLLLSLPVALGCGSPQPSAFGSTTRGSHRLAISVVSGTIASHRTDGSAWRVDQPDPVLPVLGGLIALSFGVSPLLGERMGHALAGNAHEVPPSTKLRVQIGGEIFESHPFPRTFSPAWQYRFAVDTRRYSGGTTVTFMVMNHEHGDEQIGQFTTSLGTLAQSGGLQLTNLGALENLQIGVEHLPDVPEHAHYSFHIPANASMERMAADAERSARAPGDWQGIHVLNGDVVRVRAIGSVRPSCGLFGRPSVTVSPDGIENEWSGYHLPGFDRIPHGALVALCAGEATFVGHAREFTIARPGTLLMLVNDSDPGNNCGDGFDVDVEVNPPGAT